MGLPEPNKPLKATTKAVRAMSKSNIAKAMANGTELKQKVCAKMLNIIAELATKEVKKNGIFAIPALCRFKTRTKPATKAGKREIFGKVHGQSKAREENREGVCSRGFEEKYLGLELMVHICAYSQRGGVVEHGCQPDVK